MKKNKPKKLPYKTFKSIYSRVPRATIELVIQTPAGILLSKRSIPPYKGYWHIPGGTVLFHEKMYLPHESTTILLVGYQPPGGLGRALEEGAKSGNCDEASGLSACHHWLLGA